MPNADGTEATAGTLRVPPLPPPIPPARRLLRQFLFLWPFLVWCAAAGGAAWLYFGESWHGHALAFDDVREVKVSPSAAARITTLSVELGQKVKEGDLLATLDSREVEAALQSARTELDRARARVDAERETLRVESLKRKLQFLTRRKVTDGEDRRLRGRIASLTSALSADQAELGALLPQIEKKEIPASQMELLLQKRAALDKRIASKTADLQAARQDLADLAGLDPGKLADVNQDARLRAVELEVRAQETHVAQLELKLQGFRVVAPVSGTIGRIAALPGEWRAEGAEIVEILVPRPNRLIAYVTDRQVSSVVVGTSATLRPRDLPGPPLQARVVLVGPAIEQIPLRLRAIPNLPQWGRQITLEVDKPKEALLNEIYEVRFR